MGVSGDDSYGPAGDRYSKPTPSGVGVTTMTWMMALTAAGLTGWMVEWTQRGCEQWAHVRECNL
jgi:hypothetical protein